MNKPRPTVPASPTSIGTIIDLFHVGPHAVAVVSNGGVYTWHIQEFNEKGRLTARTTDDKDYCSQAKATQAARDYIRDQYGVESDV